MKSARIIFAGSPDFAVPALEQLTRSRHRVIAVLTQPDRPAGRGRRLQASPVKQSALDHDIEVLQPQGLKKDPAACDEIRSRGADLMVVVAYGLLLPSSVLETPRRGCINIHASLLPRWRGAAPIQAAVLAGDAQTGVSLMRLEEGLDTGPVAASRSIGIGPHETAGELHDRLSVLGAQLLMGELDAILDGSAVFTPQPAQGVSYAPKLSKADALINWSEPAALIVRRIRAYNPWPVAETRLEGQQLRCWLATSLAAVPSGAAPGTVLSADQESMDVQAGDGIVRLLSVQLSGRQRMAAGVFAHGQRVLGKVLGA